MALLGVCWTPVPIQAPWGSRVATPISSPETNHEKALLEIALLPGNAFDPSYPEGEAGGSL